MPYIAIKAYPKDEKTKKEIVEKINQLFLETWGCPQEAINNPWKRWIRQTGRKRWLSRTSRLIRRK